MDDDVRGGVDDAVVVDFVDEPAGDQPAHMRAALPPNVAGWDAFTRAALREGRSADAERGVDVLVQTIRALAYAREVERRDRDKQAEAVRAAMHGLDAMLRKFFDRQAMLKRKLQVAEAKASGRWKLGQVKTVVRDPRTGRIDHVITEVSEG